MGSREIALLQRVAFEWALAGFARRGLALARRWLGGHAGSAVLRLAEITFALYRDPATASTRLQPLGGDDADAAALRVVVAVVRGELHLAAALASSRGWFLQEAQHGNTVVHVVWALNNLGRRTEAVALLREWRSRHPHVAAEMQSTLLRTEAWLASAAFRFSDAAKLLEDAVAIAPRIDAPLQREYAEADLAYVYAATGRFERAEALIRSWGPTSNLETPVDAYRLLSCASVRILAGELSRAWTCARRVVHHAEVTGNEAIGVHARFWAALCAPVSRSGAALDEFRGSVSRVQSVLLAARLRVMDLATAMNKRPLRECTIVERTTRGERTHTLARLWAPLQESMAADIHHDRVQSCTYLKGHATHGLGRVQARMLDSLLCAPSFSLPVEALFTAVWGGEFDPLRHATKLHVSLHRLRSSLEEGLGNRTTLRSADGKVFFVPDLDIRVIDLAATATPSHSAPVLERAPRLLELLRACGPLGARDIERELGLGRSQSLAAMRHLVDAGLVRREGAARRTVYVVESRDLRKRT